MKPKSEYNKRWREKNKDKFIASENSYYLNNKDRILDVKAKYEFNRRYNDLNYRLRKNLRSRLSRTIRTGSAIKDLGCSIEFLKTYLESKFQPGMNWDNYGFGQNKWQIDHIEPLFKFDLTDSEQLKKACVYANLQPIWYQDHLLKSKLDQSAV